MKTIKRILFSLAATLLLINVAMADDLTPILKVTGNKLYLSLENVAAPTSVRFLDPEGYAWIEEKAAATESFKKVFDLASLPVGSYLLVIKSDAEEILQPITISEAGIAVDESKRTAYFQANVRQQYERVHLSLLNPTNSVVRFFVLDAQGRMIYQEAIEGQRVIDAAFNLRPLPAGRYTVVVDNAHETFTKQITLR